MEEVTRTIYSAHITTCLRANKIPLIIPGSTLNEKYGILPTLTFAANEIPTDSYIAIGNKGATYSVDGNSVISITPIKHTPTHTCLYRGIPFIARKVSEDLSNAERASYRMRVVQLIGSVEYAFYYLKKLNTSITTVSTEVRSVVNGVPSSTAFTVSLEDTTPLQATEVPLNISNPESSYIVSTASNTFTLSLGEVNEIIAAGVLLNMPAIAVINEIAIVTGVDTQSTVPNGSSSSITYTEVKGAQISSFIYRFYTLTGNTTGISLPLELGTCTPQLV